MWRLVCYQVRVFGVLLQTAGGLAVMRAGLSSRNIFVILQITSYLSWAIVCTHLRNLPYICQLLTLHLDGRYHSDCT